MCVYITMSKKKAIYDGAEARAKATNLYSKPLAAKDIQKWTFQIQIANPHNADIFSLLFQNIKLLTDHISITFYPEKMFLQTLDSARVSILEISLPASWFDLYECERAVTIGINSFILQKILSSRDKSQTIKILYEDEQNDHLYIHMESLNKNIFPRYFDVPLIDLEQEMMNIPHTEYQAEISLPSAHFATLIQQLKGFGDVLEISCNENQIHMISKSIENGGMYVEIKIDELTGFSIEENEELHLSYSLQYLATICAFSKISKEVELKLKKDHPLCIEYVIGEKDGTIGDESTHLAKMKYYLAPKINLEDE